MYFNKQLYIIFLHSLKPKSGQSKIFWNIIVITNKDIVLHAFELPKGCFFEKKAVSILEFKIQNHYFSIL